METKLEPQAAEGAFGDVVAVLPQQLQHCLVGQLVLPEEQLDPGMENLIGSGGSVSLANTPLAQARLDSPFPDLDIIPALQGATDRLTADTMLVQRDYLVPKGFQVDLLAWHSACYGKERGTGRARGECGKAVNLRDGRFAYHGVRIGNLARGSS